MTVKVLSLGGNVAETSVLERDTIELDIYAAFSNAINHIVASGIAQSGVLFIIDEVDRIKNRDELASVIRSRGADTRVKFAIVGVGTTPQELILNHESIVRQISDGCIEMPPMSSGEQHEIFDKARQVLAADGFSFDVGAQDWIIQVARGHPCYVHLLGKHSLLQAAMTGKRHITAEMAQEALSDIAVKGTARIQEATYQKAIGHSYVRQLILKTFAMVEDEEINTPKAYPIISARRFMDVSSISVYVGNLGSEKFGSLLEKTRERHYRFKDSLFRAYAAARPYKYQPEHLDAEEDGG